MYHIVYFCHSQKITYSMFPPAPKFLANSEHFTISIHFPVLECHVIDIICYIACSDWFCSLQNMHLRFCHVLSWLNNSFLKITDWYSTEWMCYNFSICPMTYIMVVPCHDNINKPLCFGVDLGFQVIN